MQDISIEAFIEQMMNFYAHMQTPLDIQSVMTCELPECFDL